MMLNLIGNGKQYIIKCKRNDGYKNQLTESKVYQTLEGIEAGIFGDSPYITFVGDDNKVHSCHASRFEIVEEVKEQDATINS